MQQHLINNNSKKLIVFCSGWGCDENQFKNLCDSVYDILILYDYAHFNLDFDFTPYTDVYLIGYSAGVYVASLIYHQIPHLRAKIAVNGNPFLFDTALGLKQFVVNSCDNVTNDTYMDFCMQYMVGSTDELQKFNQYQSGRTPKSAKAESQFLQNSYPQYKNDINCVFDKAIFGQFEPFFDLSAQKNFYPYIKYVAGAKHHLFFNFNSFEEILHF